MSARKKCPVIPSGYRSFNIYLGGDPEFFLEQRGKIIGAEKVIPATESEEDKKKRLTPQPLRADGTRPQADPSPDLPGIVRDGVQGEFQMHPFTCRASGGLNIANLFRALQMWIRKHHRGEGIKINFDPVVGVEEAELESLSEASRILGCSPSMNLYDPEATIQVDPRTYQVRSAGGHIHIGMPSALRGNVSKYDVYVQVIKEPPNDAHILHAKRIIAVCDILVGNTAVLIDRAVRAAERRQVYGRSGEYRIPVHGVEYRTLSNFWLRHYPIMSLMMGLTRWATQVVLTTVQGVYNPLTQVTTPYDAEEKLLSCVDRSNIIRAINENDFDLALRNWSAVRDFIADHTEGCPESGDGAHPIVASTIEDFEFFVKEGLKRWFGEDPFDWLMDWLCLTGGHNAGWEAFLVNEVRPERIASKGKKSRKKEVAA